MAYGDATMEWVDGNLGSKLTMKVSSGLHDGAWCTRRNPLDCFLKQGAASRRGAKLVHCAPHTTGQIISKSISKNGGRSS